jgi:hypothetical protein
MSFIIMALAGLGAAFFTVLHFFRKKGLHFEKETSGRLKLLLLVALGAVVWFIVAEDWEMIFECSEDKTVCNYFHSTIANTEMRFVRSYDISGVRNVRMEEKTVYRSRGRRNTFYRIVFESGRDTFDFPKTFNFQEDAEQEIAKLRKYLFSDQTAYRYIERSYGSNTLFLVLIGGILLFISGTVLIFLMGMELYRASR